MDGNVGTPWQPTDLSSLIGWWDASDEATITEGTTSGRVSQWNDKSGNGNHLSVSTSSNEPHTGVTTLNSKNTIQFEGSAAQYLSPNGGTTGAIAAIDSQDFNICAVFKQEDINTTGALVSLKSSTGADLITPNFSSLDDAYVPDDTGSSYLIEESAYSRGVAYILGLEMTDSDINLFRDGAEIASENAGQSSDTFDRFIVGIRAANNNLWRGEIAEIVVSGALSTADRQALEGYLANKWGI